MFKGRKCDVTRHVVVYVNPYRRPLVFRLLLVFRLRLLFRCLYRGSGHDALRVFGLLFSGSDHLLFLLADASSRDILLGFNLKRKHC